MVNIEKKHQNKDLDVIAGTDTVESTPDLQTVRLVINTIMTLIRVTKRVYFIKWKNNNHSKCYKFRILPPPPCTSTCTRTEMGVTGSRISQRERRLGHRP